MRNFAKNIFEVMFGTLSNCYDFCRERNSVAMTGQRMCVIKNDGEMKEIFNPKRICLWSKKEDDENYFTGNTRACTCKERFKTKKIYQSNIKNYHDQIF